MEPALKPKIEVTATVDTDPPTTWMLWTTPEHIMNWNNASPEWHTPKAENDLREGGQFSFRMEARDGSFGFDFGGTYDLVNAPTQLGYTLGDGRKVEISFAGNGTGTEIIQVFEAEEENEMELQRAGWQAILNNFKEYAARLKS
ncbi:MAG TPA: SRPBCC domain-containing protein [Flavisolibacter sp.]